MGRPVIQEVRCRTVRGTRRFGNRKARRGGGGPCRAFFHEYFKHTPSGAAAPDVQPSPAQAVVAGDAAVLAAPEPAAAEMVPLVAPAAALPPPPPAPVAVRPRRQVVAPGVRSQVWGEFQISEVYNGGQLIGFGATCGRHNDPTDKAGMQCKKQITFGTRGPLTADELVRRLNTWLLCGYSIPNEVNERSLVLAPSISHERMPKP